MGKGTETIIAILERDSLQRSSQPGEIGGTQTNRQILRDVDMAHLLEGVCQETLSQPRISKQSKPQAQRRSSRSAPTASTGSRRSAGRAPALSGGRGRQQSSGRTPPCQVTRSRQDAAIARHVQTATAEWVACASTLTCSASSLPRSYGLLSREPRSRTPASLCESRQELISFFIDKAAACGPLWRSQHGLCKARAFRPQALFGTFSDRPWGCGPSAT